MKGGVEMGRGEFAGRVTDNNFIFMCKQKKKKNKVGMTEILSKEWILADLIYTHARSITNYTCADN